MVKSWRRPAVERLAAARRPPFRTKRQGPRIQIIHNLGNSILPRITQLISSSPCSQSERLAMKIIYILNGAWNNQSSLRSLSNPWSAIDISIMCANIIVNT